MGMCCVRSEARARTKKRGLFALRPVSRVPEQVDLECQTNKRDEVLPRYQTHGR
jgi:hypothetical protein